MDAYAHNAGLAAEWAALAAAQLCLASALARGVFRLAIPGTTNLDDLRDNLVAGDIVLPAATLAAADVLLAGGVVGDRDPVATYAEIHTESI